MWLIVYTFKIKSFKYIKSIFFNIDIKAISQMSVFIRYMKNIFHALKGSGGQVRPIGSLSQSITYISHLLRQSISVMRNPAIAAAYTAAADASQARIKTGLTRARQAPAAPR